MRSKLIILFSMVLPLVAHAQVSTFLDVVAHPHAAQIEFLHERGIIEGYGYGIFRPDITINRAEFLKILMLSIFGEETLSVQNQNCFADFVGEEQWYWTHACTAKERGIVDGYPDGTFRGNKTVNLAEALKMTLDARGTLIPVPVAGSNTTWYDPYFNIGASERIFDYFPYSPAHLLTRSEMTVLIVTLIDQIKTISTTDEDLPEWEDIDPIDLPAFCGNGIREAGEQCDDGNNEDSDGCSSICIIVDEPVRHAALRIQQHTSGALDQSGGSNDINLFGFDAIAGRQAVRITNVSFTSSAGNLTAAQNYRLFIDWDDDGEGDQLIGAAAPQGDTLTFANLAIDVEDGAYQHVLLVADLTSTAAAQTLAVGFALSNPQFVQAIGMEDGMELTGIDVDSAGCSESICWIAVFTESDRPVTILDSANLYVTQDTTPVMSRQIRAGELSPVLLRIKFRAEGEDVLVTDLAINGASTGVDYLELYEGSSQTPFAMAYKSACSTPSVGRFCTPAQLNIPQDGDVSVRVKAFVLPDAPSAVSGQSFAFTLSASTSQPAVEAEGTDSNTTLSQNDGDTVADGEVFIGRSTAGANTAITGSTHDIVASNIIAIENANTDAEGSSVLLGNVTIGAFRFLASSKISSQSFPVHLRDLKFTVTADNVQIDSSTFSLHNVDNPNATKGCSASAATGIITVTCSNLESSVLGTTIDQGDAVTLGLRAEVVDTSVNAGTSTLQVALQNLGNRSNTGTVEWNDGTTTFGWLDIPLTRVRSTMYRSN